MARPRVERWRSSIPAPIPAPVTGRDGEFYPQAQQRAEKRRSSVPASIPAPATGRDDELYPQAQPRAEKWRSSVPPPIPAPATGRDDEFYLTDEMTVFQVENLLFRVPQCLFSLNSLIFSSMFSLPHGDEGVEGRSDAEPIYLSSVTVLEFDTLLQYLFRGMNHDFKLSQSRWIALLSIAHRFDFQNVFERAMREIYDRPASEREELDDPHLIKVAEKYDVPFEYVLPNFVALVMREDPLTELEVSLLSPLTVSRLWRAREDFLCKTVGCPSSYGGFCFGTVAYGPYGSHNTNTYGGPMTSGDWTVAMEIVRGIWLPARNSD